MLNHLLISLILTGVYYLYNQQSGNFVTNSDYVITFVVVALGLIILEKYFLPAGTSMPSITGFLGVDDMSNGPNGENEEACYNVPYKIVKTQYGDRALLAGYNENVNAYNSGASGKYEFPGSTNIDDQCNAVQLEEEQL